MSVVNLTLVTAWVCPSRLERSCPLVGSQILIRWSIPAEARCRASGLKATSSTGSWWPVNVNRELCLAESVLVDPVFFFLVRSFVSAEGAFCTGGDFLPEGVAEES